MAYSNDLRIRAVKHFHNNNLSLREVASLFKIGLGTIFRWVQRYNQTGGIEILKSTGRPPIISKRAFPELRKFILENADCSLALLIEKWQKESGQTLCASAMSRTIARAGLTYKKKHFVLPSVTLNTIRKKERNFC